MAGKSSILMKMLDEELLPNTCLPLPITLWQVFDDITPTQKYVKRQLWVNVIGLPTMILVAYFGEFSWLALFFVFSYVFLVLAIFFSFYIKIYKKLILKNSNPLPVLIINNHNIKVFDNNGKLLTDQSLINYKKCHYYSLAGVNWLSISLQNKVYRYFLFFAKTSYYINYHHENYQIDAETLNNFIESIVFEIKKNPHCDFVEFNKRHDINGN